jgi:hypothetical protein
MKFPVAADSGVEDEPHAITSPNKRLYIFCYTLHVVSHLLNCNHRRKPSAKVCYMDVANAKGNARCSGTVKEEETAVDDIEWEPTETEELQQQPAWKGKGKATRVINEDLDGVRVAFVSSCFYSMSLTQVT